MVFKNIFNGAWDPSVFTEIVSKRDSYPGWNIRPMHASGKAAYLRTEHYSSTDIFKHTTSVFPGNQTQSIYKLYISTQSYFLSIWLILSKYKNI